VSEDVRPQNCRYRLRDEGKPYPRSFCDGCNRGILTGLGRDCPVEKAEADRMRARVAEMEAALRPFVFGGAMFDLLYEGMSDDEPAKLTVRLGDLRRAHTALGPDREAGA